MQKAIDQLIGENYSIQHIHVSNVPSKDLRYIQAQSDIIIDQLNYGRYGAFAREGMMLGKPVICKIDYLSDSINNSALKECPIIRADEESIYTVLKKIINLPEKTRQNIGKLSRAYMMKWHSAESCAERFEKIYDRLIERNNKCL
jgi:glycosyltransferase involved in cell wall biosynthesis